MFRLAVSIAEKQGDFFRYLEHIQHASVDTVILESNGNIEELLYSVSYEAIYRVLELIDGYAPVAFKLDLIDKETGISIGENIELHDKCADYLRSK